MSLEEEVEKIIWEDNEFDTANIGFDNFPCLKEVVELKLKCTGYRLGGIGHMDSSIPFNCFTPMAFTMSVGEHTDDVCAPVMFGIYVVDNESIVDSRYTFPAELHFFGVDGRKKKKEMYQDDILIFNPRKNHSLHYHGIKARMILFSVVKDR